MTLRREEAVLASDVKLISVIVNGKNADDPGLHEALTWAGQQGHRIELHLTQEQDDAERFASRSRERGDVVVAVGGDGTVNQVLNGIMAAGGPPDPPLVIVPLGMANDFARSCNIPLDHPAQALRLAWEGMPRLIDVGRANDRFFLNVATGGFGAEVAANTPTVAKKVLGGVAYAVTGLLSALSITPYPARLDMPGERWEGNLIVITVSNGRQAGGGVPVAPKAAMDDGLLDVMVIHDAGLLQSGQILSEMRDGESIHRSVFGFGILPRRLKIMLPPDTPLSWQ